MGRTAVVFPGQGAQFPGMGKDFHDAFPAARKVFEEASDALGYDMRQVVFEGKNLDLTEYTQPAILTVSRAIMESLGYREAQAAAGLSLGEYSALVYAEAMDFADALQVVSQRGRFMQEAVPAGVGGMTAVLKLSREKIREILGGLGMDVWIANYNCPGQIVVSGRLEALKIFREKAMEAGAKGCVDLPLSAPFHTEMLEPAARRLGEVLAGVTIRKPRIPVIFNVTAGTEADPEVIRELLTRQVMSPVLFEDSLRKLGEMGVTRFVEPGPGTTLKSFVKKTLDGVEVVNVDTAESLEKGRTL